MCPAYLIWVNSVIRMRYAQTGHHHADHLHPCKGYLRIEKDYLRLGKTIYGLKKDNLRLWSYFCRIVSFFLITWHTFNQSMNKNIWMPYVNEIIHFKPQIPGTFQTRLASRLSATIRCNISNLRLLWKIHTVLFPINAPPLINAPLTYFPIKLGKMPKFPYGVSL